VSHFSLFVFGSACLNQIRIRKHNTPLKSWRGLWKRCALLYLICGEGPPGDLPEDEAEGVHVRRLEALEGGGHERLVQHLGGHVAPRTHSAHAAQVKGTRVCRNFFFARMRWFKGNLAHESGSGHA
jgi:hypothetical protein